MNQPIDRARMEELAHALEMAAQNKTLTVEEAKAWHAKFLARDAQGNIWTVGLKSRQWHRQEWDSWVAAKPPDLLYLDGSVLTALESLQPKRIAYSPPQVRAGAADEVCQRCGAPLPPAGSFCPNCAAPRQPPPETPTRKCRACQAVNPDKAKFCQQCGKPLSAAAPVASPVNVSTADEPLSAILLESSHQRRCPNPRCGRILPADKNFCTGCGTRMK